MKDYYYFLGVTANASAEEIKAAYRKLSLKYHPDRNVAEDAFFTDRFQELQEAYEILSDPQRRREYDFQSQSGGQNKMNLERPPVIKTFEVSATHIQKGEEIILKWITTGADVVKISPFGLMPAYGERAFRITGFREGKFTVLLHANNSRLHKTEVRALTIFEGEGVGRPPGNTQQKPFHRPAPTAAVPNNLPGRRRYFVVLWLLIAFLIITLSKCS